MKITVTVEELVELAREVEIEDPIDWAQLSIDEEQAYRLMALNLIEIFENVDDRDRDNILMSMIIKLVVENFVLNLKLLNR